MANEGGYGGGFGPIATGRPMVPMYGMEGLPFANMGPMGMAAQMFLGPQIQQMGAGQGFTMLGNTGMNPYDVMRNQRFTREFNESLRGAAEIDRGNYMRTAQGMAALTNTPWGADQYKAAYAMAGVATAMSPFIAQTPLAEMLDQFGGQRGSATVMASRMMLGSRYQIDPVTGQMGLSASSSQALHKQLYNDLFNNGKLSDMKGVTAGQIGSMYDELGRRGLMEGSPDLRTQLDKMEPEKLRTAAGKRGIKIGADGAQGLSPQDLTMLQEDEGIQQQLRSFSADRVKRSLKSYVGVVATMRDIFGDEGKPNAPVQELLQSLDRLTQGGLGKVDPGRMSTMLRQTHELARQGGLTTDTVLMLQQHAANKIAAQGGDPLLAVQVTQGNMAWGTGYRASGGASQTAWGKNTADQMQQLDLNLRASSVMSEQSNRMGLMLRISKAAGGFQAGSQAEAMANAVQAGETEYEWGGATHRTMTGGGEFLKIMGEARGADGRSLGLSPGTVEQMLRQKTANQQHIFENEGVGRSTRRHQATEYRAFMARQFSAQLAGRSKELGLSEKQIDEAGLLMAEKMSGMSNADFANDATRRKMMAGFLREGLGAAADKVGNLDVMAEDMYGRLTDRIQHNAALKHLGHAQNAHVMMSEESLALGDRNERAAKIAAGTSASMSGMGAGSLFRKLVQGAMDAGEGTDEADIRKVIAKGFGGVVTADIGKELEANYAGLRKNDKELKRAEAELEAIKDAPKGDKLAAAEVARKRREANDRITALQAERKTYSDAMGTLAGRNDLLMDIGGMIDPKTLEDTKKTSEDMRTGESLFNKTASSHAKGKDDTEKRAQYEKERLESQKSPAARLAFIEKYGGKAGPEREQFAKSLKLFEAMEAHGYKYDSDPAKNMEAVSKTVTRMKHAYEGHYDDDDPANPKNKKDEKPVEMHITGTLTMKSPTEAGVDATNKAGTGIA